MKKKNRIFYIKLLVILSSGLQLPQLFTSLRCLWWLLINCIAYGNPLVVLRSKNIASLFKENPISTYRLLIIHFFSCLFRLDIPICIIHYNKTFFLPPSRMTMMAIDSTHSRHDASIVVLKTWNDDCKYHSGIQTSSFLCR